MVSHTGYHHLLLLLLFVTTDLSDSLVNHCPGSQCGDTKINYPFYLTNSSSSSPQASSTVCGYHGFGLECNLTTNTLIFKLGGDCYIVKEIDSGNSRLRLADTEISSADCPKPKYNLTLHAGDMASLFKLDSASANFTFLIDCSYYPFLLSPPSVTTIVAPIKCLESRAANSSHVNYYSYAVAPFGAAIHPNWSSMCNRSVIVPYSGNQLEGVPSGSFPSVVKDGFVLEWGKERSCGDCEDSGGRCGYSTSGRIPHTNCFCSDGTASDEICNGNATKGGSILAAGITIATFSSLLALAFCMKICRRHVSYSSYKYFGNGKCERFLRDHRVLTGGIIYSYNDIKRMTNRFEHKLGQGAYGSVFKGKLPNGMEVAVKLLENSSHNINKSELGDGFINEVATIGRIHHVNIVRLLGFCVEGSHRALIYEFMPNGSLDKFICSTSDEAQHHLVLQQIFDIARSIAKGIEYLHEGCDHKIIHLDIKPHNILLDHDFTPKISDFGLAKLYCKDKNVVTLSQGKGTIGYIAPEVFFGNHTHVSHKSDVYSFGMLLLALVGIKDDNDFRQPGDQIGDSSDQPSFPEWIYKLCLVDDAAEIFEVVRDGTTREVGDGEIVRKIATIALWCIQWNPVDRPSMKRVVEMFECDDIIVESDVPPCPFFFPVTQSKLRTIQQVNSLMSMKE